MITDAWTVAKSRRYSFVLALLMASARGGKKIELIEFEPTYSMGEREGTALNV